uniref:TM2 domain-containing protein n=1 Tax=Ascaris lumbricoides TaxID=6252 RepID=A0A0M3HNJ0_ASCLU
MDIVGSVLLALSMLVKISVGNMEKSDERPPSDDISLEEFIRKGVCHVLKRNLIAHSVSQSGTQFGYRVLLQINCNKVDCASFGSCLECTFPDCEYGSTITLNCSTKRICARQFSVRKEVDCRYCWQLEPADYDCTPVRNCSTSSVRLFRTACRVHQAVVCKGRRVFFKNVRCNWSSGYSWWKALFLSVTLGGFGADRFYLGMWKSAIGKLFSFGGLGLWTLIDVVLIAVGYVGPADGSLYI